MQSKQKRLFWWQCASIKLNQETDSLFSTQVAQLSNTFFFQKLHFFSLSHVRTFSCHYFWTTFYWYNVDYICVPNSTSNTDKQCSNNTIPTQMSTNYIMLKSVPKYNVCGAKRFKYESSAFCCGKGTIKLISHQLSPDLRKIYLKNIVESKDFRTYIIIYNNIFIFMSLKISYDKEISKETSMFTHFKFWETCIIS